MTFANIRQGLWIFLIAIGALGLGACSDGSSGSGSSNEEFGDLTISLTDAEGDFNQYTIDVTSINLYKANGAVVETLPNTARLDFSQYVEVTEFLSTATVPVGSYKKAEITLDYSNAVITVEDENGNSIPAQAFDEYGNLLTVITLEVMINEHNGFNIRPGKPAALILDFDLEASNEVTINGNSATIVVNPILIANTSIEDDKTRRLRGLLSGVNLERETFNVKLRPFRIRHHDFGKITAHTSEETVFEIDGVAYRQLEGLEVLAQQSGITPLVALGTVNYGDRRFLAHQVYAGSSVPWGDKDALKGSVIARNGNTLTVLGATIEFDDGHYSFNDEIEVLVDENTRVTKQGDPDNFHRIGDISVGQKITALGQVSDDGKSLKASLVRMRYSHVSGLVASVSPLVVDLQHVNRRLVARYDFTGTGITPDNDADPDYYEIDNGLLSLSSLGLAEPVRVLGFPTPFGVAPPDFTAKTIIDLSELPTRMLMSYGTNGSKTAIVSLDENGMLLDLASATGRHHLKQGGVITDIATLAEVPFIEPGANMGLYAISQGRRVHVYLDWEAYQKTLNDKLSTGYKVVFVIAKGRYSPTELLLSARQVVTRITE
ncbi:MAG: DUF4382 domain-containing protein [Gammaproteobacteria bacterium]|nr:DUF4382 domain-containing protein [Gammaproteobacteria bacterium]